MMSARFAWIPSPAWRSRTIQSDPLLPCLKKAPSLEGVDSVIAIYLERNGSFHLKPKMSAHFRFN
jgi:hypothetical protein